jgi:hypothetical protein
MARINLMNIDSCPSDQAMRSLLGCFRLAASVGFIESASYLGAGVQTLPSPHRGIAWPQDRDRHRVSAPAIIPTEKQYTIASAYTNGVKMLLYRGNTILPREDERDLFKTRIR